MISIPSGSARVRITAMVWGWQKRSTKKAFAFDYSQTFAFYFTTPIGRVSNLTDGTSTPLFRLSYNKSQDHLVIGAGLMAHALGDQFQITDFASSTMRE